MRRACRLAAAFRRGFAVLAVDGGARELARREPGGDQGSHDLADMAGIACLDDGLHFGELHRYVVEQAVMIDLDDVAALLADDASDLRQGAGDVGDLDPEAYQPAGADQRSLQDRREEPRVDVAAGQYEADAFAAEALGMAQQRGERRRTGALGDDFLDVEQHRDGTLERGFVGEEDVVDKRGDDRLGKATWLLDGDTLGERHATGGRGAAAERVH